MVLVLIVSLSFSSNKVGNNFSCDTNLLMPMSSLLFSNKILLSCNWLATNNNFWCRQELKMWIFRCIIWRKEIFFWQSDTCRYLNKRWTHFKKSIKGLGPQIFISKSTKSGWEKLIFSRFTQNNFKFLKEQKTD